MLNENEKKQNKVSYTSKEISNFSSNWEDEIKRFAQAKSFINYTVQEVFSSSSDWKEFLKTASNNHKYSFSDQLMIYGQNPQAVACGSIEFWKENCNRYVEENSHAIALMRKDKYNKPYCEYVFDVSATRETEISKSIGRWEFKEELGADVIESLQTRLGVAKNDTFVENLLELTANAIDKNFDVFLSNIEEKNLNNINFDGLENYDNNDMFKNTIIASTQYMVLARCGIDTDVIKLDDLENVAKFKNNEIYAEIGKIVQNTAKTMLNEIGKTCIKFNDLEKSFIQTQQKSEKPIEISTETSYNKERDLFEKLDLFEKIKSKDMSFLNIEGDVADFDYDDGKQVILKNNHTHSVSVEENSNIILKINNKLKALPEQLTNLENKVKNLQKEQTNIKIQLNAPSPHKEKLSKAMNDMKNIERKIEDREQAKANPPIEKTTDTKKSPSKSDDGR